MRCLPPVGLTCLLLLGSACDRAVPAQVDAPPADATAPLAVESPSPRDVPSAGEAPPVARLVPRTAPAPEDPEPTAATPEPAVPPLDALLRVRPPGPPASDQVEWAGQKPASERAAAATRKPKRLRVDYSKQKLLEDVPTQDKRQRTDVGVAVRVDESDKLRLKGGVRVDERKSTQAERDSNATPTVGVEVRF
jgi:hypothetical protein